MKFNYHIYLVVFIVVLILLFSCTKHETIQYQSFNVLTSDELTGIYFTNPMEGYAVGGNTWTRGLICKTQDGGQHWTKDSVFDKQLFSLSGSTDGLIIGMGIELIAYEIRQNENIIHKIKHEGNFKFIRSVSVFSRDLILAANGNGTGSIEKISTTSDSTHTVHTIDRDLNTIQYLDSLHWIAAGYGIVLRSIDAGHHWDTVDIKGDQFTDISRIDQNSLFILGTGGTIFFTENKGQSFRKIRSGGIIGNKPPFKTICFIDSQTGMIGGENQLVFITRNGGEDWIQLDDLPPFDIKDIFYDGTHFWLCGSNGTILSFKI